MEDIVPGLLNEIQDQFDREVAKNDKIKRFRKLVQKGQATYEETNEIAQEIGKILTKAYRDNINSDVLPDGRMYYNIADRVLNPTLRAGYNVAADNAAAMQQQVNNVAGIGIKVQRVQMEQDNIAGIINRISQEENYDDIKWILDAPVRNMVQKAVAFGKEHIAVEGGGKVEFRTRTSKGGLGEGFDVLIIDEAQEYQDDQESALKYVVTDSKNPQTIFCGTPPTPVSSGTVFTKYRKATLEGRNVDSGWAEWSVEEKTDPRDIEAWYETNPSLGTVFTERSVTAEIGDDDIDFNIQRLGLWIRYNQKSAISETEWNELKAHVKPELTGELYVGIKYSKDGNVAMAIASKTEEGKIFVECIDCREVRAGDTWMLAYLKGWKARKVVIDGASGQQLLEEEMREYGIKNAHLPTVKEIIAANAKFEQGLYQRSIVHSGQPSLVQAVSNCEKRAIGSNGGFGYKAIKEEIEIALLDSVILAYWACSETKVKRRKQRISC